jgi:hypothetical protein
MVCLVGCSFVGLFVVCVACIELCCSYMCVEGLEVGLGLGLGLLGIGLGLGLGSSLGLVLVLVLIHDLVLVHVLVHVLVLVVVLVISAKPWQFSCGQPPCTRSFLVLYLYLVYSRSSSFLVLSTVYCLVSCLVSYHLSCLLSGLLSGLLAQYRYITMLSSSISTLSY